MTFIFSYWQDALGAIASVVTVLALVPYIRSVVAGQTKPHLISWVIWGISTLTVFVAQWLDGGGPGTWSTGIAGVMTLVIIALAWIHRADVAISRGDIACLVISIAVIPLWVITNHPLSAVIILVIVDIVAYMPTFRKSWHQPFSEQCLMYNIMSVRNVLSIAALAHFSWVTVLFPALTTILNIILVAMIMSRRATVGSSDGDDV